MDMDTIKNKVKPILGELRGYFSAAPEEHIIFDKLAENFSKQLNEAIDELNTVSGRNYDKFKVHISSEKWNGEYRNVIKRLDYRNKLSGLIGRVQSDFFPEEQSLANSPSTVINANQTQSQTQSINTILEIHETLLLEIPKYKEGTKERTFLENLKSALPSMKTATDILSGVLKIGNESGLHMPDITKLLHF